MSQLWQPHLQHFAEDVFHSDPEQDTQRQHRNDQCVARLVLAVHRVLLPLVPSPEATKPPEVKCTIVDT